MPPNPTRTALITDAGVAAANNAATQGLSIKLDRMVVGLARWEPDSGATELKAPYAELPIQTTEDIGLGWVRLNSTLERIESTVEFDGGEAWVNPVFNQQVVSGLTLSSPDGSTSYTEGTDYILDPVTGVLTSITLGGQSVLVSFSVYGEAQPGFLGEFAGGELLLPIPRLSVFALSVDGYTEGSDYTVGSGVNSGKLTSLTIPDSEPISVSYSVESPVNEIGIVSEEGVLFAVFSRPDVTPIFKSASIPAVIFGFDLGLSGLPVESVEVVLSQEPITVNPLMAGVFGLWNLAVRNTAFRIETRSILENL